MSLNHNPCNDNKNIVIFLSDQHSNKFIGYNKMIDVKTPNLDKMIKKGVYFKNCYTTNPICMPSRTSFFKSEYVHEHGFYGNEGFMKDFDDSLDIIKCFKNKGYKTFYAGKVHLPVNSFEDSFDEFHSTLNCFKTQKSDDYLKDLLDNNTFEDHEIFNPEMKQKIIEKFGYTKWGPPWNTPEGPKMNYNQSMEGYQSHLELELSSEFWSVNKAIQFIEKCNKENKCFLIFLSFPRPHQITAPNKIFWDLYKDYDKSKLPKTFFCKSDDPIINKMRKEFEDKKFLEKQVNTDYDSYILSHFKGYLGAVSQVDAAVGRMIDYMDNNKFNYLSVYNTDHGAYGGEWGMPEKKPGLSSDAVCHIPLIFYGSDKIQNEKINIVSNINIFPTLAEYCNISYKRNLSLKKIIEINSSEYDDNIEITDMLLGKSLRFKEYRLHIQFISSNDIKYRLFNLDNDVWELNNIANDNLFKEIIKKGYEKLKFKLINFESLSVSQILDDYKNNCLNLKFNYIPFFAKNSYHFASENVRATINYTNEFKELQKNKQTKTMKIRRNNENHQYNKDLYEYNIEIPYFEDGISLNETFKMFNIGLRSFITPSYC